MRDETKQADIMQEDGNQTTDRRREEKGELSINGARKKSTQREKQPKARAKGTEKERERSKRSSSESTREVVGVRRVESVRDESFDHCEGVFED